MEKHQHELRHDAPCALVVEDEILIRWSIADVLRGRGLTVFEFATADDAWTHLQACPEVDVVFTDIRLPGSLDGLELVRLIEERALPVRAVVTSSHLPVGFGSLRTPFVPKPYDIDATAALLLNLATGGLNSKARYAEV